MELPKRYKRGSSLSYTLGPFPTFELLSCRPEAARAVYYREDFTQKDKLISLCRELNVPCSCSQKAMERISQKEICYAAGEFVKYPGELLSDRPHIALVHPGDMGNLGTIERTILGFGIRDLNRRRGRPLEPKGRAGLYGRGVPAEDWRIREL